ncbi:L-aspartate oxidase [Pseudodesulfovibrio profundus]|uniref:L-aspartate oxidase n=1 Tax=Pseudodesulfovibrio profundus TaxID=57320 RepID=A0A2C8F5N5_9BACT|nr:L-aspartate oxidase [Pseudodesulfovibrio profundus]SOB57700.1 L-aspartate oxidase [Pseudodesulfovibrio profundus]|tara:strand:+ start:21118 stop:22707 length:1590 start_codon:yes stop_codon:yes gene_type:complete
MNDYRLQSDALIIGSGIAGAVAALTLAEKGLDVILITASDTIANGNTALAQGGIVYRNENDDPRILEKDIKTAGWEHNYGKAVRYLCRKGPEVLQKIFLDKYEIPFNQRKPGDWYLTKEGGHSLPRILYCDDHTGRNIMDVLSEALEANDNIRVLTRRTAVDLLTTQHHAKHLDFKYSLSNQCVGAYVFNEKTGTVETIVSNFTLLATGGIGQIYLHTTNTPGSIGSGLAMASRAGAQLMNCEYVQFHPTALFGGAKRGEKRFLVSEAVRGEGAFLINGKGDAFMPRYDSRADLAPRDIVTRAIMDEMLHSGDDCVYLDVSKVKHDVAKRFPTIYDRCQKIGVDMKCDPVPVVPAAHYFCGGVLADNNGRTTLDRLYAAGECSCTGVHGANRLASTSLLEGLLWGYSAGEDIAKRTSPRSKLSRKLNDSIPDWVPHGDKQNEDPALVAQDWANIRNTMWNYVGVSRTKHRLTRAFTDLRKLTKDLQDFYKQTPLSKPIIDLFHGSQTAYIITLAALRNKETKGCHYRVD